MVGLVACLLALLAGADNSDAKEPWTVADSLQVKRLGDLQISPNGKQLVFVSVRKDLQANKSYSTIWLWSEGKGAIEPLTDAKGSASSPRWSPTGDRIAYFSSDNDGLGLWTMNADGSGKKRLTGLERSNAYLAYSGTGNGLSWSPDGETIAYNAAGPKVFPNDIDPPALPTGNDVMVIDRLLHKAVYFYSDLRRTHIWTIPASGGKATQLTSGDFDYVSIAWSPDGKTIACISNQTGNDDFNANSDLVYYSVETGKLRQVTETKGPEYQMQWSPSGAELAYLGRERDHRSKESDAELLKLYTRSAQGDEINHATAKVDRWVNDFQWASNGDGLYFTAQNSGRIELKSVNTKSGEVANLVTEDGQVGDFAVSSSGDVFYVYQDFTHPAELYRLSVNEGRPQQLTQLNETLANNRNIVGAEHFEYSSFDGLRVDGWVMKPANFESGKQYPLILHIHGGPHGQLGYRFSDRFQEYAANGYAVVFTNPRGSSGRGQAFSDGVVGDVGGGDYRDVMTGLDYAIEQYDFLDPEYMGVTGTSYGGYLSNWIITQTDRFKAAVPVSSISNLISAWSEGSNSLWYESDMESMPLENYELAWDRSPLKYVENAKTPTLFINGRWDFITSLNQADAMFVALKKLGIDTQIALYPEEGHGVGREPKHTADYHQRTIDWFDSYLKKMN